MPDNLPADEAIAIVGLSCRLPKALNPQQFWSLLRDGESGITQVPPGRWATSPELGPDTALAGCAAARWGGFLDQVDSFDAGFFGISPREAAAMDPQQRLVLELGWEALEDAGQVPAAVRDSPAGVFVGAIWNDYALLQDRHSRASADHYTTTGLHRGILANRLSYFLGALGPSFTVDSGQSSSLVAVHLACESLRSGESTLALAGGVNLNLVAESALAMARLGALSPDGRCYTFDARADGYVRGEGGALVVLKTLSRAAADGDRIYCLIRGSAVNNDGPSATLSTPSADAQSAVIRRAYERAGLDPCQVQYVELHGTGTKVGDPVEARAVASVLGAGRTAEHPPLLLGSAKTNVGHLEGAAGIVGLLKTALAMWNGEVPPSLNFAEPNPEIRFEEWHLRMSETLMPWPSAQDGVRLAGVSSFGIGGTNCHLVLSSAPEPEAVAVPEAAPLPMVAWVVSGHSPAALTAQASALAAWVGDHPDADARGVAWSLAASRARLAHRAVVVGTGREELLAGLAAVAAGEPGGGVVTGKAGPAGKVAFVFPGQGSQWTGMAAGLRDSSPVFRAELEACAQALEPYCDWSLLDVLESVPTAPGLDRVDVVQPALFAVMVSLAALWRSLGVQAEAVVGHSQGEIAAAYVCGALSLQDAAKVAALRSRALRSLAGTGAMASVPLGAGQVAADLAGYGDRVQVAAVNAPGLTAVAGDPQAVRELVTAYQDQGVRARVIDVDYASHGPHVEALREELPALLGDLSPRASQVPFYSTLTGERFDTAGLDAGYWYRNLRRPVRFEQATQALAADGFGVFVEASPHPVLTVAVQATVAGSRGGHRVAAPGPGRLGPDAGISGAGIHQGRPGGLGRPLRPAPPPRAPAHLRLPARTVLARHHGHRHETTVLRTQRPEPRRSRSVDHARERTRHDRGAGRFRAWTGPGHDRRRARARSRRCRRSRPHVQGPRLRLDQRSELSDRLSRETGLRLPASLIFDHPTPGAPSPTSAPCYRPRTTAPVTGTAGGGGGGRAGGDEGVAVGEPIAIVAMACRFPGGVSPRRSSVAAGGGGRRRDRRVPGDRGWDAGRAV